MFVCSCTGTDRVNGLLRGLYSGFIIFRFFWGLLYLCNGVDISANNINKSVFTVLFNLFNIIMSHGTKMISIPFKSL